MKRIAKIASLVLFALLLFMCTASAQDTLVMADSFEEDVVGQPPSGWVPNAEDTATVVGQDIVFAPDGSLAVKLLNSTEANGEITRAVGEVKKGRLVVWFMQPKAMGDNINIEVRSGEDRLVGVFITASGNVRIRDAGVQSGNIKNLPNDQWHEFVIEWDFDTQIFRVAHIVDGKEISIAEDAKFDPAHTGKIPDTIALNVSKREEPKEAFFDGVRVYSQ